MRKNNIGRRTQPISAFAHGSRGGNIRQGDPRTICDYRKIPERVTHLFDHSILVSEIGTRITLLLLDLAEQTSGFAKKAEHQQVAAVSDRSRAVGGDSAKLVCAKAKRRCTHEKLALRSCCCYPASDIAKYRFRGKQTTYQIREFCQTPWSF